MLIGFLVILVSRSGLCLPKKSVGSRSKKKNRTTTNNKDSKHHLNKNDGSSNEITEVSNEEHIGVDHLLNETDHSHDRHEHCLLFPLLSKGPIRHIKSIDGSDDHMNYNEAISKLKDISYPVLHLEPMDAHVYGQVICSSDIKSLPYFSASIHGDIRSDADFHQVRGDP